MSPEIRQSICNAGIAAIIAIAIGLFALVLWSLWGQSLQRNMVKATNATGNWLWRKFDEFAHWMLLSSQSNSFGPVLVVLVFAIAIVVISSYDVAVDAVILFLGFFAFVGGVNQAAQNGILKSSSKVRNVVFLVSIFIATSAVAYLIYIILSVFIYVSDWTYAKEWFCSISKSNLQTVILSLYSLGLLLLTMLQTKNEAQEAIDGRDERDESSR